MDQTDIRGPGRVPEASNHRADIPVAPKEDTVDAYGPGRLAGDAVASQEPICVIYREDPALAGMSEGCR